MNNNKQGSFLVTVDIEDWFQVENFKSYISFSEWDLKELRVYDNTLRLLNLFDAVEVGQNGRNVKVKATFFILGWVAKKLPELVREIEQRGHEVASHGFNHHLTFECTYKELIEDLTNSRKILEDISGKRVYGYRAPSFSVNQRLIQTARDSGYLYDSSYNSFGGNERYGSIDISKSQKRGIVYEILDGFYELPVSNFNLCGKVIPWGGGGYFRMIPWLLYLKGVRSVIENNGAFVFYIHPWEIDPGQPKVSEAAASFKFRHYVNLNSTYTKLESLTCNLNQYRFATCRQYLTELL